MAKLLDISVDCVVFGFDEEQLKVLLIEQMPPEDTASIEKRYALPGDLLLVDEGLDEAVSRVLMQLTSLENLYMEQFQTFGNPDRVSGLKDQEWLRAFRQNPEARVVTVGYYSLVKMEDYNPKADSFASETVWMNLSDVPQLAFDHNQILETALESLREKIKYHPIGFELLPAKFTLSQLQQLNETVLGDQLDKRNFRRKVQKMDSVVALDEKQKGVVHKPARLYAYRP